jgi:predicted transcriptional regulator
MWCNVVQRGELMPKKSKSVRTSVTIDSVDYEELQRLAEQRKVTVAWMVRDAVEQYLVAKTPLFEAAKDPADEASKRRAR